MTVNKIALGLAHGLSTKSGREPWLDSTTGFFFFSFTLALSYRPTGEHDG